MPSVYHITHLDNLERITRAGGLVCDRRISAIGEPIRQIAYRDLKDRRSRTVVTCGAGGTLSDYVPLYFCVKPPMLYANWRGIVPGTDGQESIVYLVFSAESISAAGNSFVFTDGHAVMAPLTHFYDDLSDISKIDWAIVNGKYWFDSIEYPDRARRRQAEFLVHSFLPWELVESIAVYDTGRLALVSETLSQCQHKPTVVVRRDWYYG